jgi:hypothetical protein
MSYIYSSQTQQLTTFNDAPPSYESVKHIKPACPPVQHDPQSDEVTEEEIQQTLTLEQKFINIINLHRVSRFFADRLQQHLFSTKVVFIFDDSVGLEASFDLDKWTEMRNFSKIAIDITTLFNPDGVDIFFLNRPVARNIKSMNDLEPYFMSEPYNEFNPLTNILTQVLSENEKSKLGEFGLLIVVLSDREPVDQFGLSDLDVFSSQIKHKESHVSISYVLTTRNESKLSLMKTWWIMHKIERFILTQRFPEDPIFISIEQRRARCNNSFGDYVCLTLLGSLDSEILNSSKISGQKNVDVIGPVNSGCNCTIL